MNSHLTDISTSTDARSYWRFYSDARQQIADLEMKRDLYARTYLAEMRKADIPYHLNGEFLKGVTDKTQETYDAEVNRLTSIGLIVNGLFSPEFRDKHEIAFAGKIIGGDSCHNATYYILKFHIGDYEYQLRCPHPRNAKESDYAGQYVTQEALQYRADCVRLDRANEVVRSLDCLCYPTYDWAECVRAIEKHATDTASG